MALGPNPAPTLVPEEWPEELQPAEPETARAQQEPEPGPNRGPCLNWLFVDMNSFFASVEQQLHPEYRNRPLAVVPTKAEMKRVLDDIQSGRFARDWMLENKVNQSSFKAMRQRLAEHPIEQVGEKLRAMMPWIGKNALVDKTKN